MVKRAQGFVGGRGRLGVVLPVAAILGWLGWHGGLAACRKSPASAPAQGARVASQESTGVVAAGAASAAAMDAPTTDRDDYYGVYFNGAKVGWMRSQLRLGAQVMLRLELTAKVAGMGQVTQLSLHDERLFDAQTGALDTISFVQKAATGEVRISGKREADALVLEVTAGGATKIERVQHRETLAQALTPWRLARQGQVGAQERAHHFDATVLQSLETIYRVEGRQTRNFGGVETQVVQLATTYPALGVTETSLLDTSGRVLEARVGGFFVARLEPAAEAQRLDFQQDILVSAAVKAPQPLTEAEHIERLELIFSGFDDFVPPSSERQQVERQADKVRLVLRRDEAMPPIPLWEANRSLALKVAPSASGSGSGVSYLAATPFIQSEAPAIVEASRQAVGNAANVAEASARLVHFVHAAVRDEYVPAFSNALEVLRSGRGDCTEHAVLFVALARAAKIAARVAVGIAYWPPGGGFGWHAWAEVWADGRWYAVDPTWDQEIADATHIKLAEGGPAEQARVVMLLGRLRLDEMRAQ